VPTKIAISSYSFHRFGGGPEGNAAPSTEEMIDRCAALGVDGIELLSEHLRRDDGTSPERLHALKQYAGLRGITPVSIAASHNPVRTDPDRRRQELATLVRTIDWAHELGAPFVRALGGRWETLTSFEDMLANNGEEPPAEGFTADQGYEWAIEALAEGAAHAGERGVTLVLENHWGLTGTAEGTKRIHDGVGSPWLKYVLDTGNFLHRPDQYAEMAHFLDDLGLVHAKTYAGGGLLVEADLDYGRIAGMLRDAGYQGYVSIEFEGRAHPEQGITEGLLTLRSALGA
jgi:sugar phosphate isomerase/epimerase